MSDSPRNNAQGTPASGREPGIAYLINRYPAISHTFILREVQGLRAQGMRIETISVNPADRPFDQLTAAEQSEDTRTFCLKTPGAGPRYIRTLLRLLFTRPAVYVRGLKAWSKYGEWDVRARLMAIFYLAEALLVGDWMDEHGLDHVHVHFGGAVAVVGMFAAAAFGTTFSFTIHGPDEYMDLRHLHVREKAEAAKFLVTISDYGRAHLLRLLGMDERAKLTTVHLGVDLKEFQPVQRTANGSEPVHVVCVGRLVKEKAQDFLLEAMAKLVHRGVNARLTLVGDGNAAHRMKQLSHELGLDDYVTFTGALPQPQTQAVLRTADVFVLPSFAEGIPVALMEAMAMEIPCISTSITGIPELISSGVDGILVRPGQTDELAQAMERLILDPAQRQRIGKAARQKVAESFNLEINVPRLQKVFARQLARASQPEPAAAALSDNKVPAA